jgi:DNA-binding response OmpR family regulator
MNRVVIVDDEQDILDTLGRGLKARGYDVSLFQDPAQALFDYRPGKYDFHIIDIRMPGMSGFDLARQIWQQDPKATVCFLTAFEIFEDEARKVFKDLNSNCFVKKPITPSALAEHLQIHAVATG